MNAKSFLASKTIWVQIIAFIAVLIPAVGTWCKANPETTIGALGAVNILVRFATSGKITLFPPDAGGSSLLWTIGMLGMAAALGTALPSCSAASLAEAQALQKAVPIHATWSNGSVTAGYDSVTGLSVTVDKTSGK